MRSEEAISEVVRAEPGAAQEGSDTAPRGLVLRDFVMSVLALASLGPILYVEMEGLQWPDARFRLLAAIDLGFVLVFLGDFLWGLGRAKERAAYLRRHWYELPGLVPLYAEAFSLLRAAQLLRLARVLRLLRLVGAYRRFRSLAVLDALFNRYKLGHMLLIASTVVLGMASVVWMLERDTNPSLSQFPDALWWAVVTATTVGYGDITPHTGLARICATVLMLMGIGLIGMVASSLSNALLSADQETGTATPAPSLASELERLAALRERGHLTEAEFTAAKGKLLG
ncbi:ion channel [Pyxidicoccus xibeiensis]|uniref:ion channel n=1 Tax=Pyxidicoccus xibeiensis TaxID=2906759 RepID=UPI0020A6EC99|nr:ion channel [Pyxidicoccus xibeiensis]MCP3144389.1 ion channel [Pyxidicoccus xibeiensis]